MKDTKELIRESVVKIFSGFKSELVKKYRTQALTISPMHYRSLQVIKEETDCTSQHVSNSLNRDKAQIARLIGELVKQGYVETRPSKKDKRNRLLMLTTSGKEVMKELQSIEKSVMTQMVKGISKAELDQFVTTAKKMAENISHT